MDSLICLFRGMGYSRHFAIILIVQGLMGRLVAAALSAFARQIGQNCVTCHAGGLFLGLTSFGRLFKLTDYPMGTSDVPLLVMEVASFSTSLHPDSGPRWVIIESARA